MLVSLDELAGLREKFKNKRIALTGGVFDILHMGHISYLEEIKNMADVLVVSITDDKRVKERKGTDRPIQNEKERAALIDAIRFVDYTCINPERTEEDEWAHIKAIQELKPDIFVTVHDGYKKYEDIFKKSGTRLTIIDERKTHSTTKIINKIRAHP